jgi:hypothetical protein
MPGLASDLLPKTGDQDATPRNAARQAADVGWDAPSWKEVGREYHANRRSRPDAHDQFWKPHLGRDLSREDARQVAQNVTAFFPSCTNGPGPTCLCLMSEYSGSAFVKINDLADGPERKTIANVEIGRYGRPILTFTDRSRLSVNVTNNKVLVRAFGDDDEVWVGQKIELYAGKTKYEDHETDSVLVRPFSPPAKARKPQSDSVGSMSDEIPFN